MPSPIILPPFTQACIVTLLCTQAEQHKGCCQVSKHTTQHSNCPAGSAHEPHSTVNALPECAQATNGPLPVPHIHIKTAQRGYNLTTPNLTTLLQRPERATIQARKNIIAAPPAPHTNKYLHMVRTTAPLGKRLWLQACLSITAALRLLNLFYVQQAPFTTTAPHFATTTLVSTHPQTVLLATVANNLAPTTK